MSTLQDNGAVEFADEADALSREARRPLVGRIRFQLGGALVAGLLLPLVLRWPLTAMHIELITSGMIASSLTASALSIIAGYVLVRQFIGYPGVQATTYILPSLVAAFASAALVMFFARIDYSRYIILASLTLSIAWLYFAFFLRNRYAVPVLALVPDGNHRGVTAVPGAIWKVLPAPDASLKGVDAVVADLDHSFSPSWERLIAKCTLAGVPVYHVRSVSESLTGRVEFEHLSENSFGTVLPSSLYLRLKRIFDLALAILLLVPFAVVIAIAAVAVRWETPGPAFFRQTRVGFRGRPFICYKLRSMRDGVAAERSFTTENDPRITRLGRFLRKYRIDEFPQIINIIAGDMGWIGPRPEAVELAQWYEREIPFYIYRHAVRPGISGWAQVTQGNVAEVEAARIKLQYDFYYIKHFSAWLDFLIVLKTIRTMLTGSGSK